MEIETMPYFPVSSGEYKAFRGKLTDAEILEVLDKISDIACFGFSNIEFTNSFQDAFFNKLELLYGKNLSKYKSCINNGKKGGRPPKVTHKEVSISTESPVEGAEGDTPPALPPPNYDITCNTHIEQCFKIYNEICKDLKAVKYERRNRATLSLVAEFLEETQYDYDYFKDVCKKANEQKVLCNNALDFKGVIKNHIAIYNEKFKKTDGVKVTTKLKFK